MPWLKSGTIKLEGIKLDLTKGIKMDKSYSGPYEDIIHLPHPVSKRHPQMSVADRAAQFSPFAALTGHDAAIKETARLTDRRVELDEEEKSRLDDKLKMIQETLAKQLQMQVQVTYFQADEYKSGGRYLTIVEYVKKIESYERVMVMTNGLKIPMEDIYKIESSLLPG